MTAVMLPTVGMFELACEDFDRWSEIEGRMVGALLRAMEQEAKMLDVIFDQDEAFEAAREAIWTIIGSPPAE